MPAMDVTSYRGDPIQESMMQLCPFWTCNIVRFGLATLYIYILQQTIEMLRIACTFMIVASHFLGLVQHFLISYTF